MGSGGGERVRNKTFRWGVLGCLSPAWGGAEGSVLAAGAPWCHWHCHQTLNCSSWADVRGAGGSWWVARGVQNVLVWVWRGRLGRQGQQSKGCATASRERMERAWEGALDLCSWAGNDAGEAPRAQEPGLAQPREERFMLYALKYLEEGLANHKSVLEGTRECPGMSPASHLLHKQGQRPPHPPNGFPIQTAAVRSLPLLTPSFSPSAPISLLPSFFPSFSVSLPLQAKAPAGILEPSHCPAFTVCGQHQTNRL